MTGHPQNLPNHCDYIQVDNNNWIYIGELTQGIPHGKGIIIFKNGDYIISDFKNGARVGIGLYFSSNGEWQTEKYDKGNCTVMSSSSYYAQIDAERNRQIRANLSDALSYLGQALITGNEFISQVNSINRGTSASINSASINRESDSETDLLNESNSSGGLNSYENQYAKWERRAEKHYNSITNLGSSVSNKNNEKSGSAAQSMSGGNYTSMKKSFREAQKQMRSIRNKAAKEGINIQQSPWETATISY